MQLNPFPQAAPNFDDPLGLLRACHGRILGHCETLEKLLDHLDLYGPDDEAREAAGRIHRYFAIAGRHHHDDEERDLFPLLRGRSPELDALIDRLLQEHAQMDRTWLELEPLLTQPERLAADARRAEIIDIFVTAYRAHVDTENNQLLPQAKTVLSADETFRLGESMARRRGVTHG